MPPRDYEEFIAALNRNRVKYLIVGAHAVAHHARPRATKDLDIYIERSPSNARKALSALGEFFGADLGYGVEDLMEPGSIIQLGVAPVRIDLMFRLNGGADFAVLWKNRVDERFGSVPTHYVGLEDLIAIKKAAGRAQDRADLRVLKRARERG